MQQLQQKQKKKKKKKEEEEKEDDFQLISIGRMCSCADAAWTIRKIWRNKQLKSCCEKERRKAMKKQSMKPKNWEEEVEEKTVKEEETETETEKDLEDAWT